MVEDLDAAGGVPLVVTGGPGQRGAEGLDQVVEAPGQNHDVVGVAEEHDHHGGEAQPCREATTNREARRGRTGGCAVER